MLGCDPEGGARRSPLVRGEWIEIFVYGVNVILPHRSPLVRGERIEMASWV